jgi:hypothetical protein
MARYLWHVSVWKQEDGIVTVFKNLSLKLNFSLSVCLSFLMWPFSIFVVGVESYCGTWPQWHTHSVVILWTNGKHDAESTWQHTTLTIDRHPCLHWDSNRQSHRASGRKSTHYTERSPRLANLVSHAQPKHRLRSTDSLVVRMFDS